MLPYPAASANVAPSLKLPPIDSQRRVETFLRGRSRFSYRATIDLRLQKTVTVAAAGLDVIADADNVLNAHRKWKNM